MKNLYKWHAHLTCVQDITRIVREAGVQDEIESRVDMMVDQEMRSP